MKPKLFIFVLGVIVGLLLAFFVPPVIQGWLPEGMGGAKSTTTGVVVAKRLEKDRLLLTVESSNGAVLATFKQKVPEIDLLVDKGDEVTLGITSYEPFVEDPKILGVKKADQKKADQSLSGEAGTEAGAESGMGSNGAGAAGKAPEAGAAAGDGAAPEAGEGSGDKALPPMGPPLEDEPGKPPAGDDGGGANQS